MKLAEAMRRWPDHDSALAHLEHVRWGDSPSCSHCNSEAVSPHASADRKSPRWQCRSCQSTFSVTAGTVFQRSRLPLHSWYWALTILLGESRVQTAQRVATVLNIPYKTAWNLRQRIMAANKTSAGSSLFTKILSS